MKWPEEVIHDQDMRIVLGEHDLYFFGHYYFADVFSCEDSEYHEEYTKLLSFDGHSKLLVKGHRDSAKTTWAKIKIIHAVCYRYKRFIPIISHESKKSEAHLFDIATQLQTNVLLIEDFGQLFFEPEVDQRQKKSKKKNIQNFITENKVQVKAFSTGISLRGEQYFAEDGVFRPDLIFADDFETDKTKVSDARTLQVKTFLDEMLTAVAASCDVVFCCNKISGRGSVAFLEEKARGNSDWVDVTYNLEEDGRITWPARFKRTKQEAEEWNKKIDDPAAYAFSIEGIIEEVGTRRYMQEYNNVPITEDEQIIKEAWIDNSMFLTLPENENRTQYVIAFDPQAGESTFADEYALTVIACHVLSPDVYVVESVYGKASQLEQAALLIKYYQQYKPRVAGVEVVMNQVAVYQLILQWHSGEISLAKYGVDDNDRNINIVQTNPGGLKKTERLQLQEAKFERGEIHLKPSMLKLREQLIYFGINKNAHDDVADSLIIALELAARTTSYYANSEYSMDNLIDQPYSESGTVMGNLIGQKY